MTLRHPSLVLAPLAGWLSLVGPTAGCVQITDFGEPMAGSDESTSDTGDLPSTSSADEGPSGSDESSGEPPSEAGVSAWLRLSEQYSAFLGVSRASDGRVRALGEEAPEDLPAPRALARFYAADGESFHDVDVYPFEDLEHWELTDACERPDGGLHILAFFDYEDVGAIPLLINFEASEAYGTYWPYDPAHQLDYAPTITNVPRMVCDEDGRAWVALPNFLGGHSSVILARVGLRGFDGHEQLIGETEGHPSVQVLGLGRDALGDIHLGVQYGVDPASGEPLVGWLRYDADGVPRSELGLGVDELGGTRPLGFAARGSHVVFTTHDPALDLTWVVAYDLEGTEQWRTSDLPQPAQGWTHGPMRLAEDGSVVMTAAVGEPPEQHLGLLELDEDGVLQWSAEYPFEADGELLPTDMTIADLDVGPDAIDVVGSVSNDGGPVGWVRHVLR